jgi:hypothetical protein
VSSASDKQYRDPAALFPEEIFTLPNTGVVVSKSAEGIVHSAFENGEPVFVLRAKDIFALPTISKYLGQVRAYGPTNSDFEKDIENIFQAFRSWQESHIGQVRYPD